MAYPPDQGLDEVTDYDCFYGKLAGVLLIGALEQREEDVQHAFIKIASIDRWYETIAALS